MGMDVDKSAEIATQTDETLIYNYAWQKFYHYFQTQASTATTAASTASEEQKNDNVQEIDEKISSIDISPAGQQPTEANQTTVYELKNGIYFDAKHGLYYDSEMKLYFDHETKIYYKYKLNQQTGYYHIRYHSKISSRDWKILSRKLEIARAYETEDITLLETDLVDSTRNQKLERRDSSSGSEEWVHDKYEEEVSMEDLTTKYPPCLRVILIETNSHESELKPGSLFLIPYTGGSIGRNSSKNLIDFGNETEIEQPIHAVFGYDMSKKEYFIEDQNSTTGTFLNEIQIEKGKRRSIVHNDKLRVGQNCLLLHIHAGTTTCVNCEPGEVMAKLEKNTSSGTSTRSKANIENTRREANREMKKKYGLKWNNQDYKISGAKSDRAKIRRETVGVDTSHITDKAVPVAASVQTSIKKDNIGFKLLKNMGWQEGKGLGKQEDGVVEPINTKIKIASTGLGYEDSNVALSLDASEQQKLKQINWNKTRNRFNLLSTQQQPQVVLKNNLTNVFNVESDEEENE